MGITSRVDMYFTFDSAVNLQELLCVMENGTWEQSSEAVQECFDFLSMEEASESKATYLVHPLLDLLCVRNKSVAKANVLNRMTGLMVQDMDIYPDFGVTPSIAAASQQSSCRYQVWRTAMIERLDDLLVLLEEDEATAVQTIYALHLLQCEDERVEAGLLETTLHTKSARIRLNGLLALTDWRRRAGKPYNPAIAFGQAHSDALYEAMRAVCMCLTAGQQVRAHDWSHLLRGVELPRIDRMTFPWADGSPAACCAQAARIAMTRMGWERDQRAWWWKECLSETVKAHRLRSRTITWECGQAEVQWDEEWLQWNWNGPMLIADNMLQSLFLDGEAVGAFHEQCTAVREALKVLAHQQIESPNASKYGVKHLLYPLNFKV